MRLTIALALSLLFAAGCNMMLDPDSLSYPDRLDAGKVLADASGIDAGASADAEVPDTGLELPDTGTPDTGSNPGLDASEPPDSGPGLDASSEDVGTPDTGTNPGLDASEPPDAAELGLDASVSPDSGFPNPFPVDCEFTNETGVDPVLANGTITILFRDVCQGGHGCFMRYTIGIVGSNAVQVSNLKFFRDGVWITGGASQSAYLNWTPGEADIAFSTEDDVAPGAGALYKLTMDVSGVVSADDLVITVYGDPSPPTGITGFTAYVYHPTSNSLYSQPTDMCSPTKPNIICTGAATHTPPTPACLIAGYGSPDYTNGFWLKGLPLIWHLVTTP